MTFRTVDGVIDTSTPIGRLIFAVLGAVAEFEHELILERTAAGRAAGAAKGRKGGRPSKRSEKLTGQVKELHANPLFSSRDAWEHLGISKTLFYSILDLAGSETNSKNS